MLGYFDWNNTKISGLVLGTAQLGMQYGVANSVEHLQLEQAHKIVATAWCSGINVFDTAQAYGNSEAVLGSALKALDLDKKALVVTKLSPDVDHTDADAVRSAVERSCQALCMDWLWCFMLHHEEDLQCWNKGLGQTLVGLRHCGRINHIGVSVYSVNAANAALENPDIDVIQIPCNAWDRRMAVAEVPERAKQKGKLCFVRSVYLQGLLTLSAKQVWKRLPKAATLSERWCQLAAFFRKSPQGLAFCYALSLGVPLVIGAETAMQVTDNTRRMEHTPLTAKEVHHIGVRLGPIEEDILNPALWAQ